jgi:hypothetical protein
MNGAPDVWVGLMYGPPARKVKDGHPSGCGQLKGGPPPTFKQKEMGSLVARGLTLSATL